MWNLRSQRNHVKRKISANSAQNMAWKRRCLENQKRKLMEGSTRKENQPESLDLRRQIGILKPCYPQPKWQNPQRNQTRLKAQRKLRSLLLSVSTSPLLWDLKLSKIPWVMAWLKQSKGVVLGRLRKLAQKQLLWQLQLQLISSTAEWASRYPKHPTKVKDSQICLAVMDSTIPGPKRLSRRSQMVLWQERGSSLN